MKTAPWLLACLLLSSCVPVMSSSGRWVSPPTVRPAQAEVRGVTLLVSQEVSLEADDPEVLSRMKERNAGVVIRDAMARALGDAGFTVSRWRDRPYDVEVKVHARSALTNGVRQEEYRIALTNPGGAAVDELRWVWPADEIVKLDQIAAFAGNNLANAIADSRKLADGSASRANRSVAASTPPPATIAGGAGSAALVAASPQPGSYALVVGIERYRDLPSPTGARRDAEGFAQMLRRTLGLKDDHVRVALDDRATRTDIDKHLEWLKTEVPAGSRVYFYFSGHGAPDVASGSPYLLPFDGDPKTVERTGLGLGAVMKGLGETRAKEALTIVDACFSGAGGRSVLPAGARPLVRVKDAAPPARVALFSATGASEISGPAPGAAEGLFTRTVLEGLGGGKADADGDGQISLAELAGWVKPRVTREALKDQRAQTPTLTMGAGESADKFIVGYGYATK